MNPDNPGCTVVAPSGTVVHEAFGDRVTFYLTGESTAGRCTSFLIETPPGGGPPPHRHDREDEWFLVLEGRAEFLSDGRWTEVEAGASVFAPRTSVHAFRNVGESLLKLLVHTAPSGFEHFFAAMAAEFQAGGGPDLDRVKAISADFGITYPES